MKTTKKNLPKAEVELTVEVQPEELKPYLSQAAIKISQQVNIPGFRKGHIPYDILKKNVGEATIYEEAFYTVVNKTLPEVVEQEKIDFVGQPKVDVEKVAPGNPLIYKVILALMPTITLGNYKELKSKRKKVVVDEEKVKKTFVDLKKMRAQEKLVTRAAKLGDKAEVNFNIKLAGVGIEGGQAIKYPLVLGEKKFIPGFEEQIIGLKKDDQKKFKMSFPKDYFDKKTAGRECDFEVKVEAVYEVAMPELNDDFASSFNFKNWQEMDKQIRDNIKKEIEQKEKERLELSILEEIIEKSNFSEFPELLITSELGKMMEELKHNVEDSGGKIDDYLKHIKKTEEDLKKELQPQALKRIKTALVSREIAKQEKIEVSEQEIKKEIEKYAKAYEKYPDMAKQFQSTQYQRYLGNILANQKTFERLVSFIKE